MRASIYAFVIALLIGMGTNHATEPKADGALTRRLERILSLEDTIEFYGQVLDQFGKPVDGATVIIHVDQATLLPTPKDPLAVHVITDSKGTFAIDPKKQPIRGSSISIDTISRDGYEVIFSQGEKLGFDYRKDNPNRYVADMAAPVAFHMRKKEANPTFLFQETSLEFQVPVAQADKAVGYDFIERGRIRNVAKPAGDDAALVCDLQVKATFNANDGTWAVVLSPGTANGGIIASEHLIYEAPESGYQPEYAFTPESRTLVKAKYVYLKNRDPAIYTRLDIQYVTARKEFLRLVAKSVTNPYGERNLEQATDLPYEVTKQLADDAKAAFRQGKRPSKPDLPKLIKKAQEQAEKDKR